MHITFSCRSGHERGDEEEAFNRQRYHGAQVDDEEGLRNGQVVKIYPSENVPLPAWTFPTGAGSEREDKAFFGWESLYGVLRQLVLAVRTGTQDGICDDSYSLPS